MSKPFLILPVEHQVRELDARLLIACAAAQRGYRSLIGWKGLIDAKLGRFPPSVYLAKTMTKENLRVLRIKRRLGHQVVAWDEEAVVHYPRQIYYARRIGPESVKLIDHFVAWGEDNLSLFEGHPNLKGRPIHVLGNPRADLLRPELREFHMDRVHAISEKYGKYILINTNFGSVNGHSDRLNLFRKGDSESGEWIRGRSAIGMPTEYAQGLFNHRRQVFKAFQTLVKQAAEAFPDRVVIVRPHPSENHDFWQRWCSEYENVEVTADGSVIPWLLAAGCVVHNSCTTAVEAYLLGRKVLSFIPLRDERYEFELPNKLGDRVNTVEEAIDNMAEPGNGIACTDSVKHELISRYISSLEGEFATQKIIDIVDQCIDAKMSPPSPINRLSGIARAECRALNKTTQRFFRVARYDPRFMRQRFPTISTEAVKAKVDRLTRLIGGDRSVGVLQRSVDLFETYAA